MAARPDYAGADPTELELGWQWIDAVSRRDAEALIAMADQDIALHPTRLVGDGAPYVGHDGVRRWVADLSEAGVALMERVTEVRHVPPAHLLILGQILVADRPISPLSILMSLRAGKIAESHAYLSDEVELKRIGRLPG